LSSFFLMCSLPPRSTLFPYTTLFRSDQAHGIAVRIRARHPDRARQHRGHLETRELFAVVAGMADPDREVEREARDIGEGVRGVEDRKSTRLNSSHVKISYAVFCLKKK